MAGVSFDFDFAALFRFVIYVHAHQILKWITKKGLDRLLFKGKVIVKALVIDLLLFMGIFLVGQFALCGGPSSLVSLLKIENWFCKGPNFVMVEVGCIIVVAAIEL